ncbi:MAG TPA: HAD family hydrolase [Planctomycetes bacterium]|nr:HAD family hydrolase [Planctomycetota bacterium]
MLPAGVCRDFAALLCDLDDTLTTRGKLHERAFAALWEAQRAGLPVVVVTGRPAGWCDHIARMWPVHGVIGENGGLYFRQTGGKIERWYAYGAAERARFRARLDRIRDEILAAVPGCAVSADQPYREFDLAIDFCEDVPRLSEERILRIQEIFHAHGARARISSIHVNGWFGEFDKLSTARRYLRDELGLDPDRDNARVAFAGDSPNDEPMFAFFRNAAGVANIRALARFLKAWPAYIAENEGGEGFAEIVRTIAAHRGPVGAAAPDPPRD